MTRYLLIVVMLSAAGCYSVETPDSYRCSHRTDEAAQCPSGFVCNGAECVPEGSRLDTGPADGLPPDVGAPDGGKQLVAQVFAGTGSEGVVDGPVQSAQFWAPSGLAADAQGNIYVADTGNHCIRKISNGDVSTIAGKCGEHGSADGSALGQARFLGPVGILVNDQGQLLVADTFNHCIRRIGSGAVTTVAGVCGIGGHLNGAASIATFLLPYGVMLGPADELLVSDTGNHCIRKVDSGQVSTFAGTCGFLGAGANGGPLLAARFRNPSGIWPKDGGFIIGDTGNNCIRAVKGGQVTTIAGTCSGTKSGYKDGPALQEALFQGPTALVVAGSLVYISDTDNHCLRRLDGSGVSTFAGNGQSGSAVGLATQPVFNTPAGILPIGPDKVLVADAKNHRILVVGFPD